MMSPTSDSTDFRQAGVAIRSTPMYGRSASGTTTLPSARWHCSRMATSVRPTAARSRSACGRVAAFLRRRRWRILARRADSRRTRSDSRSPGTFWPGGHPMSNVFVNRSRGHPRRARRPGSEVRASSGPPRVAREELSRPARARLHESHEFHLVELMLADEASDVLSVRSGLALWKHGVSAVGHG